jgi:hypothetical protein
VQGRQPPPAKRAVARGSEPSERQAERNGKRGCRGGSPHLLSIFVARGSEPSERQAERSRKRGCGGGCPHLPSASLPAVASRLQDKPSEAESGGVGAVVPTCDSKILKVGYAAVTIRRERKAPGRAPADCTAGIALGRAEVWGQRPQLLTNLGVHTNEHRLFDSAEHSTGGAPVGDDAGQAAQNNNAMRLLSRRRRSEAPHAGGFWSTAT